jgi:anti-anti-sigma regulatory factor
MRGSAKEGRSLKLHLGDVEFMDAQGVALLKSSFARCFTFGVLAVCAEQLKATGKS